MSKIGRTREHAYKVFDYEQRDWVLNNILCDHCGARGYIERKKYTDFTYTNPLDEFALVCKNGHETVVYLDICELTLPSGESFRDIHIAMNANGPAQLIAIRVATALDRLSRTRSSQSAEYELIQTLRRATELLDSKQIELSVIPVLSDAMEILGSEFYHKIMSILT
ncbi:MAG: hypothetical protein KF716_27730 [Anaerolineae bacterium]|nr:hypothetical protein [Anaerolineae bacterium]